MFCKLNNHGNVRVVTNEHIDGQIVRLVVMDNCELIGLNPKLFGAHSLRSGLITAAGERGIDRKHVKNVTHHQIDKMLDHYDKRGVADARRAFIEAFDDE